MNWETTENEWKRMENDNKGVRWYRNNQRLQTPKIRLW